MSRRIALDWWEVAIQAFITVCLAIAASEAAPRHDGVIVPSLFAVSALVFALRRNIALRRLPDGGLLTGEVHQVRLDDVEQRLAEMEMLEARLAELENRVEFSERLLAKERNTPAARLEAP